jgi:eukaryotic-like serine/threonine-protein kinase
MDNPSNMSQDAVGTRKGDYEILGLLGAGGMGQVYKVRNVFSDRVEAMKVLLPNLADQKNLADRFLREIKVLAGLHHPNIAELRTALMLDNQLVMIMEFVDGQSLAARVQQGAIPYGQALGYTEQVLSALSYAHKQRIIHRDIKPANMMLTPDGVVKLMDFGIARHGDEGGLTLTNTTLGSLSYMSPEQVKGDPTDGRSDLYSLGVSLYELVTGQRPFQADTAFSIMQAHLQTAPKPPIELRPDLPPAISQLILMAVAKDPAHRFQSADAFATAIRSVAPNVEGTVATAPVSAARTATMSSVAAVPPPPIPITGSAPPRQAAQVSTPTVVSVAPPAVPYNPSPAPPMPPPPQPTHRGLYITLGAVIVLVVLVLGALYVPKYARTHAIGSNKATTAPDVSTTPAPATPAAATPATPDANAAPTAAPAAAQPAPAKPTPAPAMKAQAPAPPPGPDPKVLRELGDQVDQISSRAAAVNGSLEILQKQQAAQGLGLRGDMVAAQQRMQIDIAKAQSSLQQQDVDNAQKYIDMANAETEKLEHFLGR